MKLNWKEQNGICDIIEPKVLTQCKVSDQDTKSTHADWSD